tara:strand:+ start:291 stop:1121 length:831 start_codon:yes stop_codon:yes gene_type:complete
MSLPDSSDVVVIHYGCSEFKENTAHNVFWIGAIHYYNNEKVYFYEDNNEEEVLKKYLAFQNKNEDKIFVHWSMNSPGFGFSPIQHRYNELIKSDTSIIPQHQIDLSEYLKEKYGINYTDRDKGRLNHLAELNGFSGFKTKIEVKHRHEALERLELIFSIWQAECQEKLKVLSEAQKENPYPHVFTSIEVYFKFVEYIGKYIISFHRDYSYLKKRLQKEKLIYNIKDKDFFKFLYNEMKIVSVKDHDEFIMHGKFISLDKSSKEERINNYNNIFLNK